MPAMVLFAVGVDSSPLSTSLIYLMRCLALISLSTRNFRLQLLLVLLVISMIIASYGNVSLRGVCLDWRGPFEIWEVTNEG